MKEGKNSVDADKIRDLKEGMTTKVLTSGRCIKLRVGRDAAGFYVTRPDLLARSKSYKSYQDIPDRKVAAIRATM
jgi:hypothetical protein